MKMILVLEGNEHDQEALQALLQDHGYAVSLQGKEILNATRLPRRTEQPFHCICETGPLGVFRSSLDGKLLSINAAGARMHKYGSPQEMIATVNRTSIAKALYLDSSHRQQILTEIHSSMDWHDYEEQFRCKDGSVITCVFHIRAVRDADGRPIALEGFLEDISERKRAERELKFTQFAIDKTIDQAFWMTPDGRCFYVNEAACAALGYSRDELEGMSIWDVDPNVSPENAEEYWQQLKNKGSVRFESLHQSKDGRTYPVEVRSNYVNFDGKEYSCAFVADISERQRAEQQLRQASLVLENSPAVLFRWKAEEGWPVEMVSGNVIQFGYLPEELLSGTVPYAALVHPEDLGRVIAELQEQISRGENKLNQEYRIVTKQGEVRWVDDRTLIERDAEGRVTQYQGIVMDITDRKRAEEALRESERKYRSIVEHAPFGITRSTRDGKLVSVNPALAAILKYDSAQELQETINRSSIQEVLFPKPSERAPLVENVLTRDSWYVFNNRLRCKDGSFVICRVHSRRIVNEGGQASEFESYQENITDQLAAEQAERESEEKFRVLAETSPVAICLYQGESVTYANPALVRLFGYGAEELYRMKFWGWAHDDFKELIRERGLARLRGEPAPGQYEAMYVTKNGEERYVLVSAGVVEYQGRSMGVASFLDISERKRTEELIRASLAEKDVLLKEIHHRVKNNLQVVSSLLFLQSQRFADPELQTCFLESQSRICSMALAHEQLYQSKNLAEISVRSYVESLVGQLEQIFISPGQAVDCRLEVEDLDLDIEKVVPCGLLITELLSNAYKHAFADDRSGNISISLQSSAGQIELAVADDGVGLPAEFDYRQAKTLGLQLVTALVNQLGGTLELESDPGTRFRVSFAE